MRIALVYDNFVRDYRGFLLLSEFLKRYGHKVWILAGWNNPASFCKLHHVEVMIVGQIAESATATYATFCKGNNIVLVVNTSEPATAENAFPILLTYNTNESNQEIIDLQTVCIRRFYDYITSNGNIEKRNLHKYKYIGYPRTDITYNLILRRVESHLLIRKYNLARYSKKYIFISSFLFDSAFEGVPEKDLERWNYDFFRRRTNDLVNHTLSILKKFVREHLNEGDILLVKKHPWDCSDFLEQELNSEKCLILDNTEFITTCLDVSDVIIHTYSTSAIEAWIMGKPTVSIFLEKYYKDTLIHMEFERVAFDYNTFIRFLSEPHNVPDVNNINLFDGSIDGKGTVRLANEINALKPRRNGPLMRGPRYQLKKLKSLFDYFLIDWGLKKYKPDESAKKFTKLHDFMTWENQRSVVNKLYKKPIKNFVKKIHNV